MQHISKDSELVTDESSFYTEVGAKFLRHRIVSHETEYVSKDGTHTNNIEGVWSHFKRIIFGTYFHMSFWHYYRYLNEHAFRWNVRNLNLRERFDGFAKMIFGKRIKYADAIIDSKFAA